MTGRELTFERLFNVRDLGGLTTAEGRTVRRGLIFRSDDPHRATEADVDALRALGIHTVIDLRMDLEVDARGSAAWTTLGLEPVRCSIMSKDPVPADLARYIEPEFVRDEYLAMLADDEIARRLWRALAAAGEQPRLIHCASGRDRTAVVSAFLLEALGVSRDDVLDDYEASAAGMERMLTFLDEHLPAAAPTTAGNRYALVRTPRPCMAAFLDAVDERWGSPEGYLEQLGLEADLKRLRTDLLDD